MCTECTMAFFLSPVKSGIVVLSFAIAIAALVMLRGLKTADTKKRLTLLYIHVFAFVFPFLFFIFFRGCQSYFSGCDKAKAVITLIGLTAFVSAIIALSVAPVVFARKYTTKAVAVDNPKDIMNRFLQRQSEKLGVKRPGLYVLNTAKPAAFSFYFIKPRIFLSAGLFDILGRREIEAILLHELAHIKSRASLFKLSAHIARLLSPMAVLANFIGSSDSDSDEAYADEYAAKVQGTSRYLDSTKGKIAAYIGCRVK